MMKREEEGEGEIEETTEKVIPSSAEHYSGASGYPTLYYLGVITLEYYNKTRITII